MKTLIIIGVIVLLLGILFIFPATGMFSLAKLWPAILLLLGLGFFAVYFAARKIYGFLMPGAILVISSIPFFMCTISGDWSQMVVLWPVFILSVAVGFLLMYFLGARSRSLLLTALILFGVAVIASLIFNYIRFIFPTVLIASGLTLIFIGIIKKMKTGGATTTEESETEQTS